MRAVSRGGLIATQPRALVPPGVVERLRWPAALAVGLVVLVAAVRTPVLGFVLLGAAVAVALAVRSVAIPAAVWGSSILISLLTAGRLPKGGTVSLYAAWTLLGIVLALRRRGTRVSVFGDLSVIGTLGIAALLAVRLPASPSPAYGYDKVRLFLIVALVPFAASLLIGRSRADLRLFLRITILMGVATALYDVVLVLSGGAAQANANRLTLDAAIDPIGLARTMGELLLLLLAVLAHSRRRRTQLLTALGLGAALVALLASGSRGPLTALVLAAPLLLLTRVRDGRAFRRLALVLVLAVGLGAGAVATVVPHQTAARALSVFTGQDEEAGETTRGELWGYAFEAFPNDPVGALVGRGTGAYESLPPFERYPHNVVVELLLELGLVGVALFALVVGAALVRLGRLALLGGETGALGGLLLSLFVFSLVNAMFSGDVAGNGALWVWLGLGSGVAAAVRGRRREAPSGPSRHPIG